MRFLRHTLTHTHTHRHTHTRSNTHLKDLSAGRKGSYLHNTQQTQGTNIHAYSGIRTRDLSNRVAADLRHSTNSRRNGRVRVNYYKHNAWNE